MGPGKARLIGLIASTGSISAAAREMGMSYRRAWQLVEAINASFKQPVVVTAVGGKRGGGAVVTDFGKCLVEAYHLMESKASATIAADLRTFEAHLRKPASRTRSLYVTERSPESRRKGRLRSPLRGPR
jgi:molybdate transport system regulatory protein